jgi:pilus assembly protein Flp/PilA
MIVPFPLFPDVSLQHTHTGGVLMSERYLHLRNLLLREKGQDLAEYGMLVAFIALVVIMAVTLFGDNLRTFFNGLAVAIAGW